MKYLSNLFSRELRIHKTVSFGIYFFAFLLVSCKNYSDISYSYYPPEATTDGIKTSSLSEVALDSIKMFEAVKRMKGGAYGQIHSVLIHRKGHLVLEEYFSGNEFLWEAPGHYGPWVDWDKNKAHHVQSVTKSFTSACIGIAIDKGMIASVDQSIFDYLPDHQQYKNNGRENLTIEHLLTMTSGQEWTEWGSAYSDTNNPIIGIWFSEKDPVSFILEGRMVHEPGSHYSYYGGNQILLGEILKNASGLRIDAFSEKYLFQPMGSDSITWASEFSNGVLEAAGGLKMRPRDMLKFGITFLNNGMWNNQQVISEKWVDKSSVFYKSNYPIKVPGTDGGKLGYSYSWWTKPFLKDGERESMYWAGGWGGQKIVVIPSEEMVIVFTGGNYNTNTNNYDIIEEFVLPAAL